jgi:hypothetical protein
VSPRHRSPASRHPNRAGAWTRVGGSSAAVNTSAHLTGYGETRARSPPAASRRSRPRCARHMKSTPAVSCVVPGRNRTCGSHEHGGHHVGVVDLLAGAVDVVDQTGQSVACSLALDQQAQAFTWASTTLLSRTARSATLVVIVILSTRAPTRGVDGGEPDGEGVLPGAPGWRRPRESREAPAALTRSGLTSSAEGTSPTWPRWSRSSSRTLALRSSHGLTRPAGQSASSTCGRSANPVGSAVRTDRPVARAVAAMTRSWAPRGRPVLRVAASSAV